MGGPRVHGWGIAGALLLFFFPRTFSSAPGRIVDGRVRSSRRANGTPSAWKAAAFLTAVRRLVILAVKRVEVLAGGLPASRPLRGSPGAWKQDAREASLVSGSRDSRE